MSTAISTKPLMFKNTVTYVPLTPDLQQIKLLKLKGKTKYQKRQQQNDIETPRINRKYSSNKIGERALLNKTMNVMENKNLEYNQILDMKQKQRNFLKLLMGKRCNTEADQQTVVLGGEKAYQTYRKRSKQNVFENNREAEMNRIKANQYFFGQNQLSQQNKSPNLMIKFRETARFPLKLAAQHMINQPHQNINPHMAPCTKPKNHKVSQLQAFKSSALSFSQKLQLEQKQLRKVYFNRSVSLQNQLQQLNQNFQKIILQLKTKQKQVSNTLMMMKQQTKVLLDTNTQVIKKMRKSISKYLGDIDKHYHAIIEELELEEFDEIIWQYKEKLRYFDNQVNIIRSDEMEDINISFSFKQIEKFINKISIHSQLNQNPNQNKIWNNINHGPVVQNQQQHCRNRQRVFSSMENKKQMYKKFSTLRLHQGQQKNQKTNFYDNCKQQLNFTELSREDIQSNNRH